MNIAIIGASGFVGKNLIKHLLENTDHNICAISLDVKNIKIEEKYKNRITLIDINIFDYEKLKNSLVGIDIVYYFIHMLNYKGNFYKKENQAAEIIGKTLKEININKVIYMSGLGRDNEKLSKHLESRHNTGNILRNYIKQVIEFRASMIIGKGSASFEIVKDVISHSPIVILPETAKTETQPISIDDTLLYLRKALDITTRENLIIEIGGEEVMSYKKFLEKYNKFSGRDIPIFVIPFLPERLAGLFLQFFTTKDQAKIGQNMIHSFKNEMIVTNNLARELFPDIHPKKVEESFII